MGYRTRQRIFNRGIVNDLEAPKEMSNVLSHKGNENHNNSEMLPYKDKLKGQHMLVRMWSKGNTPPLLLGMPLKEGKGHLTETSCSCCSFLVYIVLSQYVTHHSRDQVTRGQTRNAGI